MRPPRLKRWLGSYAVGCGFVGAAVAVAIFKRDWPFATAWSAWIVLIVVRYRFFPEAQGRRLHPPNESTLQFLRKRRRAEETRDDALSERAV